MARGTQEDPIKVFRFRVEIEGGRAGFSEVSTPSASVEIVEYREGGDPDTPKKSAALVSFENITLKRGQIIGGTAGGDNDMFNWFSQVYTPNAPGNSNQYRKDFDIVQYNGDNAEVARWRVRNGIPAKFVPFSTLNATESANSIQEIEIAHEGFTRVL